MKPCFLRISDKLLRIIKHDILLQNCSANYFSLTLGTDMLKQSKQAYFMITGTEILISIVLEQEAPTFDWCSSHCNNIFFSFV